MEVRKFISINSDGMDPSLIRATKDEIHLYSNPKDNFPVIKVENDGSGYAVRFYKRNSNHRIGGELRLDAGQLADLTIIGIILSNHFNLAHPPEIYELLPEEREDV